MSHPYPKAPSPICLQTSPRAITAALLGALILTSAACGRDESAPAAKIESPAVPTPAPTPESEPIPTPDAAPVPDTIAVAPGEAARPDPSEQLEEYDRALDRRVDQAQAGAERSAD